MTSTKHEALNSKQIRNSKYLNVSSLSISDLFRVSVFGFRIYAVSISALPSVTSIVCSK